MDHDWMQSTYCGLPPAPADLPWAWNGDWRLLLGLAALAVLARWAPRPGLWAGGWAALVLAFVSPLCALTVALFAARAVHHLLLLTVAAPLLGAAWPALARRMPAGASLLLVAMVLGLWHVPAVYSRVWLSDAWYWGMQLALLLPATLFWARIWVMLRSAGATAQALAALGQIAALAGVMGLIGAVLTFAPQPLYAEHGLSGLAYGLQPLQDQQLAGLLMWVPGLLPLAAWVAWGARRMWRMAQAGTQVPHPASPAQVPST